MKYDMLISFIVPIYNTEKYVANCIDSILKQGVEKSLYEIILIDDGSIDNSSEISLEYSKVHNNIYYHRTVNNGVSTARNIGMGVARGLYLIFLDSDDILSNGALNKMVPQLSRNDIDILIGRLIEINVNKANDELYPSKILLYNHVYSGLEIYNSGYRRGSVCGVAISRHLVESHRIKYFEKIANGEDTLFIAHVLSVSNKIIFIPDDIVYVNVRQGSAYRSWDKSKIMLMIEALKTINNEYKNENNTLTTLYIDDVKYSIISNIISYNIRYKNLINKHYIIQELNDMITKPISKVNRFSARWIGKTLLGYSVKCYYNVFSLLELFRNNQWIQKHT